MGKVLHVFAALFKGQTVVGKVNQRDKNAKDYLNSVYINKNVLPERIEIKSRDSAGYVTEILADGLYWNR